MDRMAEFLVTLNLRIISVTTRHVTKISGLVTYRFRGILGGGGIFREFWGFLGNLADMARQTLARRLFRRAVHHSGEFRGTC